MHYGVGVLPTRPRKPRRATQPGHPRTGGQAQPALRPLPAERFDLSVWTRATVNIDYHIQFERSFYSVPYFLTRQTVEVRATPTTIEIFHRGQRVASHVRAPKAYTAVTNPEQGPASHRAHFTAGTLINFAGIRTPAESPRTTTA